MALGAGMSGHRIGSVRSCAGPFAVNGVPIRRVNQAYVIATKTTVDVSAVNAAKFDDAYFKRPEKKVAKKSESEFFAKEEAVRCLATSSAAVTCRAHNCR